MNDAFTIMCTIMDENMRKDSWPAVHRENGAKIIAEAWVRQLQYLSCGTDLARR